MHAFIYELEIKLKKKLTITMRFVITIKWKKLTNHCQYQQYLQQSRSLPKEQSNAVL